MNIVLFTHPEFSGTHSISKYSNMIAEGMRRRNHRVEIYTAQKLFYRIPLPEPFRKWLGYLDQFLIFPIQLKMKLNKSPSDTLFVFADHALGSWISLVKDRPHLIHCHDFLAQRSAQGEIPENLLSVSGKMYQALIRKGYRSGRNFISISKKTESDLRRFLIKPPQISEVVYNGLNQEFAPGNQEKSRDILSDELRLPLSKGYILHVGGNQFYKNRKGIVEIYNSWRSQSKAEIPLLLIGAAAEAELKNFVAASPYASDINFASGISNRVLRLAYQGASVFLFPSLDEGFGWPIAEAMASGCPVITTNEAPMNEVGGLACMYIRRRPSYGEPGKWASESAQVLEKFFRLNGVDREELIRAGLVNAKRFDTEEALEKIEKIYREVIKPHESQKSVRHEEAYYA